METDKADSNLNPKELVILGETDEAPRLQQWLYNRAGNEESPQPFPAMLASLDRHKSKSKTFDMGSEWSGAVDPGKTSLFFNSLDRIDDSWLPKALDIWVKDEIIIGLKVFYTNGHDLQHGACDGSSSKTIDIQDLDAKSVIQLVVEAAEPPNSTVRVRGLQLTFNTAKSQEYPALGRPVETHQKPTTVTFSQPTNGFWTFRGFWGSVAPYQGGFIALGAIWGLDETAPESKSGTQTSSGPVGPDYQMFMGQTLPEDALASAKEFRSKVGKYSMSNFFGENKIEKEKLIYFNDLGRIKDGSRVKSVTFYTEKKSYLTGYIINYINGPSIQRGRSPPGASGDPGGAQAEHWTAVRLVLSRHSDNENEMISYLELNNAAEKLRSFSAGIPKVVHDTIISPPSSSWSLAGFWGYYHDELQAFTHIGVIWAKCDELAG